MRSWVLALVLVGGCGGTEFSPLFDPTLDGGGGEDVAADGATADQVHPETSQEASQEADGGLDAAPVDTDAPVVAEDAPAVVDAPGEATPMDGGVHHEASPQDAGPPDAPPPLPCDGAGLSTHHTGTGLTWTDCVPVGTHTVSQALQACATWCASMGCVGNCFSGQVCSGSKFTLGQVGVSGPSVVMLGWSADGDVEKVNPVTQSSCNHVGSWD